MATSRRHYGDLVATWGPVAMTRSLLIAERRSSTASLRYDRLLCCRQLRSPWTS
ncbi:MULTISPECIES: hypothetical protein [unclassified Limnothrix]|uniref:hypothetical protein n=1 Tax=unclassified Limnothrix TaxID=2632864 RepID=UPI0016817CA6|nr:MULTISPECIES: hypothetical protein [unclassified Limnothrix]MBD2191073.1 hypothetical protein [Limnothrix sp. FACHB-1088]